MLTFPKHPGMISGSSEFVHFSLVNNTYCGIITTAKGIMIVASSAKNNAVFPRNSILAKANAAREEVNPPISSTGISTIIVLKIPLINSPFLST